MSKSYKANKTQASSSNNTSAYSKKALIKQAFDHRAMTSQARKLKRTEWS